LVAVFSLLLVYIGLGLAFGSRFNTSLVRQQNRTRAERECSYRHRCDWKETRWVQWDRYSGQVCLVDRCTHSRRYVQYSRPSSARLQYLTTTQRQHRSHHLQGHSRSTRNGAIQYATYHYLLATMTQSRIVSGHI